MNKGEGFFFIVRRHHTHICAYIFPETRILYTTGNRKDKKDSKHNIKKNLNKKKRERKCAKDAELIDTSPLEFFRFPTKHTFLVTFFCQTRKFYFILW